MADDQRSTVRTGNGRRRAGAAAGTRPATGTEQFLRSPHDAPSERSTGSALERALAVLETVVESEVPLGLQEIATRLSLPRQSAHRILSQLLDADLIQRHYDRDRFVLGARIRRLALETMYRTHVGGPVHAVLVELAERTGETCNIGVLDSDKVLLVDRVESHWALRVHSEVGKRVDLHSSAMGQVLLAHLPKGRRHRLLTTTPLRRYTAHTLHEEAVLEERFTLIRRQGYVVSNQGTTAGMFSVAVPLRDPDGRVVAAVACQAPMVRMDIERADTELAPVLIDAAARIEQVIAADWPAA
ncbi:MAG: IclR family transcriptional regulator [Ectothiorhodospiraceae bacterium]|nr:IclR family transcriptional regulator [Ectothiorhodospiraceae bacterium]